MAKLEETFRFSLLDRENARGFSRFAYTFPGGPEPLPPITIHFDAKAACKPMPTGLNYYKTTYGFHAKVELLACGVGELLLSLRQSEHVRLSWADRPLLFFYIMECFVPEADVRQGNVARAMSGFLVVAVE